jgi:hypothetical protein
MTSRKPPVRSQTPITIHQNRGALERVLDLARAPLFPGESEAEYVAFAERFVSTTKPADAIEEILVRDVIDLTWECFRLRRIKAGLVKANMRDGVGKILTTVGGGENGNPAVRELSEAWAAGDREARAEVQRVLEEANLSLDEVTANTVDANLDSFERLDRMLASSEARRNNALREIDRHREAFGAATRRALDDAVDVEFRDVETGETIEKPHTDCEHGGGERP